MTVSVASLTISALANAAVGVVVGADKFADDGLPFLKATEQAKVFLCHGRNESMSGPGAMACAMEKCKKHFKVPAKAKADRNNVLGGHCKEDSWAERRGYAVAYVGDPGDNRFIFSKALGDPTREEAMKWVKGNKFPVKDTNKAFDFYDDGFNGKDTWGERGSAPNVQRGFINSSSVFNERNTMLRQAPQE